ncbi:glycosyltransferase [Pontiella agarivorans]|uniref:Glycosyltransferase n=1 Tax=Pontiella agarivorans TaxID=3038953 RepID=A0ABU5N155_9BACT|nr:glycosyltransferase [Pontiella agarivorans]MDZ8120194.1 glycosyltransferase [Pontiella agarivorans]
MKTNASVSKADLHVHSKYSNRPSEWFLRRIGAPESFMEPLEVYQVCKKAGMDFVTISDHNCICGAKEIAHLPGTFISAELTTYFPENGCKVHCLVSGITENQFRDMQKVRENIYDLRQYMNQNRVIHTIAHPLFRVNDKLTVEQVEKLLVMFNRFEGINGSRVPRACEIGNAIFSSLTPDVISSLADKHNLEPVGLEPWNKTLTGGSDDHGGLYVASAYTVTPHAPGVIDFLEYIREGQHEPGGVGGTSVRLANSLYRIAYCYYKERLLSPGTNDRSVIGNVLKTMAETPDEKGPEKTGFRASVKAAFQKKVQKAYVKTQMNELEQMIVEELTRVLENDPQQPVEDEDSVNFKSACRLSQELSFAFIQKAAKKIRKGELIGSLQAVSSLGPVALGIAPYLTAFATQHKDEEFLRRVANRFPAAGSLKEKTGRKAWVTDTFTDVNGVTKTIRTLAAMAKENHKEITVITSLDEEPTADFPVKNFKPVGSFRMPEYESLMISYPPFMEMLAYLEKEEFDEVIISTPGTLGICALGAAYMLGLKTKGIYHTDFPRFFSDILDDEKMGEAAWRFMRWFYGRVDQILVPTRQYKTRLMDGGFDAGKIDVMPRGINRERFSPEHRNRAMWEKNYNRNGSFKFIYAGRVSREKNIEVMLKAFTRLVESGSDADLIVVGDGPQRDELQLKYNDPQIVFTGYLYGDELAEVYASADLFVFPSLTDTFGNVVLEAHASGLPAIVSNEGGPQEIVESHNSGLVVNARTPDELFEAMKRVTGDYALYEQLKINAGLKAQDSRWEHALEKL